MRRKMPLIAYFVAAMAVSWAAPAVQIFTNPPSPQPVGTVIGISVVGKDEGEPDKYLPLLRYRFSIAEQGVDGAARVWNATTGQVIATLGGHSNRVYTAAFSPDGRRVVTASSDKTARVWNVATGQVITTLEGHTGDVSSALFSRDGQRVVTASDDGTARVWNASTGQVIAKLEGYTGTLHSAAFSPDGQRILTAGQDRVALIFKIVTLDDIARLLASN